MVAICKGGKIMTLEYQRRLDAMVAAMIIGRKSYMSTQDIVRYVDKAVELIKEIDKKVNTHFTEIEGRNNEQIQISTL